MRTVNNLLQAALKVDLPFLVEQSLFDASDEYIRIQKEQMFAGERSDGTPIFNIKSGSEYYSKSYAKYKGKESPIDLKDTGDFYKGFNTKQESGGISIDSDDWKSDMLKKTYGAEIFTLNDTSKIEFNPIAQGILINGVEKELNKK